MRLACARRIDSKRKACRMFLAHKRLRISCGSSLRFLNEADVIDDVKMVGSSWRKQKGKCIPESFLMQRCTDDLFSIVCIPI